MVCLGRRRVVVGSIPVSTTPVTSLPEEEMLLQASRAHVEEKGTGTRTSKGDFDRYMNAVYRAVGATTVAQKYATRVAMLHVHAQNGAGEGENTTQWDKVILEPVGCSPVNMETVLRFKKAGRTFRDYLAWTHKDTMFLWNTDPEFRAMFAERAARTGAAALGDASAVIDWLDRSKLSESSSAVRVQTKAAAIALRQVSNGKTSGSAGVAPTVRGTMSDASSTSYHDPYGPLHN